MREVLADAGVQDEVRRLSGEEIHVETAFELGRAVGVFHPKYSRAVLLAMLRALRRLYREMREERTPIYLRKILEKAQEKGMGFSVSPKEAGGKIVVFDHWPTEEELAVIAFSQAMNPNSKAEVLIVLDEEGTRETEERLRGLESRLRAVRDVQEAKPLDIQFSFAAESRAEVRKNLEAISLRLTRWLAPRVVERYGPELARLTLLTRKHIVVTMEEDLARRLETEDSSVLGPLYGMKQVWYGPASLAQYSAVENTASRLSQRDYEALSEIDRRFLERVAPEFFRARYSEMDPRWEDTWLFAQAQLEEVLRQAA